MFIVSINSKDGKPVVPPFCVSSLSSISSLAVECRSKHLVLIVDSIDHYEDCSAPVQLILSL